MPTVSAIIPTYNRARFLADAIKSVLDQTFRNVEVIVVDDGSTDDTPSVAGRFGNAIRYIRQANRGVAAARNAGVRAATGQYVAFLDSDDAWLPTFLAEMLQLASQHAAAAAFYCGSRCMTSDGRELTQIIGANPVSPEHLYVTLLRTSFILPSSVLARRAVIEQIGYFDEALELQGCEDWDLCLRIARDHLFVGSPNILVRYRLHADSLSVDVSRMQQSVLAVVRTHFGLDDGRWGEWTHEKRRAYGGAHRYGALMSVIRQKNWEASAQHLARALQIDPDLALDVDLFYELALGDQPIGYRGTPNRVNLEQNSERLMHLLTEVFSRPVPPLLLSARRMTHGTACYALALASYNLGGNRSATRGYLVTALRMRRDLWRHRRVHGLLVRAVVHRGLTEIGKRAIERARGS